MKTIYEKILIEIIYYNNLDKPIWESKIIKLIDEPRNKIFRTIDLLLDIGMIYRKYGEIGDGHISYRYYITKDGIEQLERELYK